MLLGNGAGGFTGGRFYATASQPFGVVLTDLTRDGKLDLAYACVAGASVSVRAGDGTGRFGAALTVGALADPNALAPATSTVTGRRSWSSRSRPPARSRSSSGRRRRASSGS